MISVPLRRIAADSNVLLSAVIGKAALRVFTCPDIEVVTTEFNITEVREYIPHLAWKYHLDLNCLLIQLQMLPLIRVDENYYKRKAPLAKKYLRNRDSDDIHLAALALEDQIPVWSNDKDFSELPVKVYSTKEVLKVLKSRI